MKIVKTLLIIIGVLVSAFIIWNASLPSNFEVHRSVSMNAAPESISATVSTSALGLIGAFGLKWIPP